MHVRLIGTILPSMIKSVWGFPILYVLQSTVYSIYGFVRLLTSLAKTTASRAALQGLGRYAPPTRGANQLMIAYECHV